MAFTKIPDRRELWNDSSFRAFIRIAKPSWMYLNGVVLVSPTGLGIKRDGPVVAANRLPYFAAAAWYHKMLPAELQNQDLELMLKEVETYAINKVIPAIAKGGFLKKRKKWRWLKNGLLLWSF